MIKEKETITHENHRLNTVIDQIESDIDICTEKIGDKKETLKEINQNMLSEFKFETDTLVNLEGAATMWHYQTLGVETENSLDYQIKRRNELRRLNKSAYFAKITFHEQGYSPEDIYIGPASLVKKDAFDYLIYDWRAPIAGVFYDFETGDAEYKSPAGIIEGQLTGKRHYKINHRNIDYMFDSNLNIMDDILKEALAKSVDDKMSTIVTTIQKEQNQIIRDDSSDVLVVRGSAGSGKTSIALHRIAYLLYKNREKYKSDNVLVFTPNDIFSDYIGQVLPELGEAEAKTMTFMTYMEYVLDPEELGVSKLESWYDQMAFILSPIKDKAYYDRIETLKSKSSQGFFNALEAFINGVITDHSMLEDVKYGGQVIVSKEELVNVYMECPDVIKYSSRLKQLQTRIFRQLVEIRKKVMADYKQKLIDSDQYYTKTDINQKARKYVKRKFKPLYRRVRAMTTFNVIDLYNEFLDSQDMRPISNTITYEDGIAMIYLKGRLDFIMDMEGTKVVVIDEAQDYTLIQYHIFRLLFKHAKFTILGDPNQAIHPYLASDIKSDILGNLGNNVSTINLTKTYRSTKEIFDFCNNILPNDYPIENLARHGEKPSVTTYSSSRELRDRILEQLTILKAEGKQSAAVIGQTKEHCIEIEQFFKNDGLKLMIDEDLNYNSGVLIIPSYLAKGLEFDAVFVVTDDRYNYHDETLRKLFYTVCSRALHFLEVCCLGNLPILLK